MIQTHDLLALCQLLEALDDDDPFSSDDTSPKRNRELVWDADTLSYRPRSRRSSRLSPDDYARAYHTGRFGREGFARQSPADMTAAELAQFYGRRAMPRRFADMPYYGSLNPDDAAAQRVRLATSRYSQDTYPGELDPYFHASRLAVQRTGRFTNRGLGLSSADLGRVQRIPLGLPAPAAYKPERESPGSPASAGGDYPPSRSSSRPQVIHMSPPVEKRNRPAGISPEIPPGTLNTHDSSAYKKAREQARQDRSWQKSQERERKRQEQEAQRATKPKKLGPGGFSKLLQAIRKKTTARGTSTLTRPLSFAFRGDSKRLIGAIKSEIDKPLVIPDPSGELKLVTQADIVGEITRRIDALDADVERQKKEAVANVKKKYKDYLSTTKAGFNVQYNTAKQQAKERTKREKQKSKEWKTRQQSFARAEKEDRTKKAAEVLKAELAKIETEAKKTRSQALLQLTQVLYQMTGRDFAKYL